MVRKFGCTCIFVASSLLARPALAQDISAPGDRLLQNHPDTPHEFPNFAQALTEWSLKQHPDVLVIAFHAQLPGEQINHGGSYAPSYEYGRDYRDACLCLDVQG